MSQPILQVDGLSFSYEDKPRVLQDVSFSLDPGETVGIIGSNGAGKTTLFMTICGVFPATTGKIHVDGEELVPRTFHKSIGYVFQNSNDQLFSPTVWDDVAFGPINLRLEKGEVEDKVREVLERCGVAHVAGRSSHHLSGGEKRMVAIAAVLSLEPSLVIYDEPTSNLDMRSRRRVMSLIGASSQTSVIASHDLELIVELCPRVILIDDGQIQGDGETREIMADWELMDRSGLEVPHSLRK